jgi:hypothetical protein
MAFLRRDPEFVTVELPEGGTFLLDEVTGKVLEVDSTSRVLFESCEQATSVEDCWRTIRPIQPSYVTFLQMIDELVEEEVLVRLDEEEALLELEKAGGSYARTSR